VDRGGSLLLDLQLDIDKLPQHKLMDDMPAPGVPALGLLLCACSCLLLPALGLLLCLLLVVCRRGQVRRREDAEDKLVVEDGAVRSCEEL
jgi:hypothetical protein